MWGLGIILFGMVFGYAPFGERQADEAAFDKLCVLRSPLPSMECACERWLTCEMISVLNCRANLCYINSWVKDGEAQYPPGFAVDPMKAAYAAKLASGDTAYDNLKKMCDGMLAMKGERWSLQTCLVRTQHLPAVPYTTPH